MTRVPKDAAPLSPNAGSGSDVVEDLPSRRPLSVVAVIGHPRATSGQFQMATNTDAHSRGRHRLLLRSVEPLPKEGVSVELRFLYPGFGLEEVGTFDLVLLGVFVR
jgi:hypothetical protein